MIKVFLDDVRPTPDGWVRAYWPDDVITMLITGDVGEISLDHDLGDDDRGTGYDVLKWLEQAVFHGLVTPPVIHIHSANPAAVARMEAAITQIHKTHQSFIEGTNGL